MIYLLLHTKTIILLLPHYSLLLFGAFTFKLGEIVQVFDDFATNSSQTGKIIGFSQNTGANTTTFELDRTLALASTKQYDISFIADDFISVISAKVLENNTTTSVLTLEGLTTTFVGSTFILSGDVQPRLFKVVKIDKMDDSYSILALEHNDSPAPPPGTSTLPTYDIPFPTEIAVSTYFLYVICPTTSGFGKVYALNLVNSTASVFASINASGSGGGQTWGAIVFDGTYVYYTSGNSIVKANTSGQMIAVYSIATDALSDFVVANNLIYAMGDSAIVVLTMNNVLSGRTADSIGAIVTYGDIIAFGNTVYIAGFYGIATVNADATLGLRLTLTNGLTRLATSSSTIYLYSSTGILYSLTPALTINSQVSVSTAYSSIYYSATLNRLLATDGNVTDIYDPSTLVLLSTIPTGGNFVTTSAKGNIFVSNTTVEQIS